jgi:hypothetical protein
MLAEKVFRGFKEGQYHKCGNCGGYEGYRMYVRTRRFAYDYQKGVYGKDNSRQFQPIGWFCIECKHTEIDEDIPGPVALKEEDIIKKLLSKRETEFLNDILKLKNDNSDWYGHYRIDWHNYEDEHGHYGHVKRNFASKELFSLNPTWTYNRQRIMKSRILRKRDKILSDANAEQSFDVELLKTVSKRLERL